MCTAMPLLRGIAREPSLRKGPVAGSTSVSKERGGGCYCCPPSELWLQCRHVSTTLTDVFFLCKSQYKNTASGTSASLRVLGQVSSHLCHLSHHNKPHDFQGDSYNNFWQQRVCWPLLLHLIVSDATSSLFAMFYIQIKRQSKWLSWRNIKHSVLFGLECLKNNWLANSWNSLAYLQSRHANEWFGIVIL